MNLTSEQHQRLMDHFVAVRAQRLDELADFIRIPSVSKSPPGDRDMARAAEFVAAIGREGGAEVEILATKGHPAALLEWRSDPADPTILFYGHLDVQPAEPAGFEPTIRDGRIYGRGATDMKGPLLATLNAISAIRRTVPGLRLNVKLLAEGEEEIGSPSLSALLDARRERLAADVAVISDTMMWSLDQPAICIGLRGWTGLELTVRVAPAEIASSGLHSGDFGGVAPNALHVLSDMVASLHDRDGRIGIPGFYAEVPPIDDDDRTLLAQVSDADEKLRAQLGARALVGESGFTAEERITCRPTVEVVGMSGGYTGPGIKNAVPRRAQASLSIRLVGGQRPEQIAQLIERHLRSVLPDYADLDLIEHQGTSPLRLSRRDPHLKTAAAAVRAVYGVEPWLVLAGSSGTAPILLSQQLGLPPILAGFSSPGENPHAADENFHLVSYDRGSAVLAGFLSALAAAD